MTDRITPQEAQQLRDAATEGPWMLNPYLNIMQGDDPDAPVTAIIGRADPYTVEHVANGELMAAAPRLARTVIDQGKKIEELEEALLRWELGA